MPVPACKRSAEAVSRLAASARVMPPVLARMLSAPVPASTAAATTLALADRRSAPPAAAPALRAELPAAMVRLPLAACRSRLPPAVLTCAAAPKVKAPAASTERWPPCVATPAFRLMAAAEPVVCSNTLPASSEAMAEFTVRAPTLLRSTMEAAPGSTPAELGEGASACMPLKEVVELVS